MENLKEIQKQEAIKRMRLLQIMPQVVKDYEKNDRVYYSERLGSVFLATLYWLDNHQEYVDLVKEFEKKHKALVYHAQLTHMECGDCLSLFYVSKDKDNWSQDIKDILDGMLYSYVVNLQCDYDSEFGYIGVKPVMGGVVRTF